MKTYNKLLLFLSTAALLGLLAGVLVQPFFPGFTYYKVVRRVVTIFGLLGAVIFWKYAMGNPVRALGLSAQPPQLRNLLSGFALGILAILIYIISALAMNLIKFESHRFDERALFIALWNLPAAALIGLVEEFFFRGVVLQSLFKDMKIPLAVIITSLFYALLHIKGPLVIGWPKLIGLFILGIALSYGYLRSGALFLPIGLHAGLIYGIKLRKTLFAELPSGLEWLFGDKWLVGGVISWAALCIVILAIRIMPPGKVTDE